MRTHPKLEEIARSLSGQKVLLITTSNRWSGDTDIPKSTQLADEIARLAKGAETIEKVDVGELKIYPCEGNISTFKGNKCGVKASRLADKSKNPSGHHRCWASVNHEDDDLWKISAPLLEADVVLFFVSVRWGQTNAHYQKLIERLTWLENRWTTEGESNLLEKKRAGIIAVGHNWRGEEVIQTQKQVLQFFGFSVPDELSFNWQWTNDVEEESREGYKTDPREFLKEFKLGIWSVEEK
jgi:multimeric flavodoxin WrbA